MLSRYRHVIWDWNGTLLDDLDFSIEVVNEMLRRRRLPEMDRARYHAAFDFPIRNYYERIGLDVTPGSFEQLSIEFITAYDAGRFSTRLHSHALAALDAVERAGLTQSILSAYRQSTLQEVVAHFGLAARFVRLTGLDNIYAHSKAERGRAWIADLGLPPTQVLMIGDTLHDLEVARGMGVDCALVAAGHHPLERLRPHCDLVFENLATLLAALETPADQPPVVQDRPSYSSGGGGTPNF